MSPSEKVSPVSGKTQALPLQAWFSLSYGLQKGLTLPIYLVWGLEPQVHLLPMDYLPGASAASSDPNKFPS